MAYRNKEDKDRHENYKEDRAANVFAKSKTTEKNTRVK